MNAEQVHRRLCETRQRQLEQRRERELAAALVTSERKLVHRVRRLLARAQVEQEDVDRLASVGLLGLLRRLSGDHAERLTKERAEALEARIALEQCEAELADVRRRRAEHTQRADALGDVDAEYAEALMATDRELGRGDDETARALRANADAAAACDDLARRNREVVRAGEEALAAVDRVGRSLDAVEATGALDLLRMHHAAAIERARGAEKAIADLERSQAELARFEAALGDRSGTELVLAPERHEEDGWGVLGILLPGTFGPDHVARTRARVRAARKQVLRPLVVARKESKQIGAERARLRRERERLLLRGG